MRQELDVVLQELFGVINPGSLSNVRVRGRNMPDIVAFGGKTQISGVFFNPLTIMPREEDVIGISQGSPINVLLFAVYIKVELK